MPHYSCLKEEKDGKCPNSVTVSGTRAQLMRESQNNELGLHWIAGTFLHEALLCLRYLDDMETIYLDFYKKVENLLRNTPNYAVRIDRQSKNFVKNFEMILNWFWILEKIYDMDKERHPKICFERLKLLADCDECELGLASQTNFFW